MELLTSLKQQLVETGLTLVRMNLTIGTGGNLSARVPEEPNHVLITPSAMPYDTITPDDIVTLDLDGRVVAGHRKPSIEWELHLNIYRARPDVGAVVHTHGVYSTAMAVCRQPLPPIFDSAAAALEGEVPVAEYAISGSSQLAASAARALGRSAAVLLANHGAVVTGETIQKALYRAHMLERACEVYILSRLVGSPVTLPPEIVQARIDFVQTRYSQP